MLGATSEIELDANGERVAAYNLMNYVTRADGTKAWVQVGNVWPTGVELTSTVHWTSGRTSTPVDVPTVRRVPRQVSVAASTTVIVLASFGILVTAIVLAFNVHYRDLTFIKMSSPIFNNVILVGVIVGFVYIIVLGVSNGTNCLVRVALLSFAFSMCFGGLFIKTYRVAAIFNTGAEAKVVKIKNRLLFAYMGALIAIDVVIICVWAIVDPITTLVTDLPSIPDDLDPDNSIVQPYISRCNSVHYDTFLGTIYGVKGIIIIWGAFLSARTSHVTIPALNDSKQIGLAIYTTGLISLSIVPGLEFLSPEQVTVQFIMASMAVIVGLFANIAILFVPKIQAVISGRHAKLTKTQAITNDFATRKPTTTPTPHT
ncbi:G-protein coupled receptors family 3 profile domain-containing protein [Plasmodiophora brassicae]